MHFFTELTIPSQNSTPSVLPYGPQSTLEETNFITYSHFAPTTPTKIFACQRGLMFIQDSPFPDTVNIIIKPTVELEIAHTGVKYYIYRGVKKDSFVTGANITPSGASESEFIYTFWDNWSNYKIETSQPGLPDPAPASLGLEAGLLGTIHVEDIFNNSQIDARPVLVKEGDWIGEFSDSVPVTFEIITDSDHLPIDLDFLRSSSSGISASMTTPVTPEDIFTDRNKREQILAFIDPSAFFGMYFSQGIKVSEYSPGKITTTKKEADLYNDVLSLFATKNRIYIDIRGEYGYSYNYYDDYGDTSDNLLKIKDHVTSNFVDSIYYTHKWPIYYTDDIQGQGNVGKTELQLRIDDNIKPLLFFRDKKLIRQIARPHFINEKKLLDGSNVDWSKTIKLRFPNIDDGGSKVNIARCIQIQYFRQDYTNVDTNRVLFPYDINDHLFVNLDLPQNTSNIEVFQHVLAYKYSLISGNEFAYIGRPGVYADNNEVVYYTQPEFPYKQSKEVYPLPSKLKKTKKTSPTDSPVFRDDVKLYRVGIVDEDLPASPLGNQDVFVLGVSNINRNHSTSKKEDFFMLGITATEFSALVSIADSEGLSKKHLRKITFTTGNLGGVFEPANGIPYYKYELNIHGYGNDGFTEFTELVGTGVFVYTLDGRVFNSKAFGDQSSVLPGLPDPGTMQPWKHIGKWSYNKNDSSVQVIHPTGFVVIEDEGNNQRLNPIDVELVGFSYYPKPSLLGGIGSIPAPRPAVFIVHGNGHEYEGYENLCKHLARNGFIATSISCLFNYNPFYGLDDPGTAYAPFTHYFRMDGSVYFYNNTSSDAGYEQINVVIGTDLDPITMVTEHVKKWILNDHFSIDLGTNRITFLKELEVERQGMAGLGRANLLYEHMKIVKDKFGLKIQNNIGILGHSRGGESVIMAANEILNTTPPNGVHTDLAWINMNNIQSVVSLAPTHQYDQVEIRLERDVPYLVVYGSRDYDVSGGYATDPDAVNIAFSDYKYMPTGYSLYDRAHSTILEKYMVFVHGATHNGFITTNAPDLKAADDGGYAYNKNDIASHLVQINISFAYFNAHFRRTLFDEDYWIDYLKGDLIPESVETEDIFFQHETIPADNKLIKYPSYPFRSGSIGTSESYNGTLGNLVTGDIRVNDGTVSATLGSHGTSPHYSNGITLDWEAGKELKFNFPPQNVNTYAYISFRCSNAIRGIDLIGLQIGLESNSLTRYIELDSIVSPDKRSDTIKLNPYGLNLTWNLDPTKNAMQTIRVPLTKFDQLGIDLTIIKSIRVLFPLAGSGGKIIIDNIMFTK